MDRLGKNGRHDPQALLREGAAVMARIVDGDHGARLRGHDPFSAGCNAALDSLQGRATVLREKLLRHLYLDELTDLPNRQRLLNDIQKYSRPVLLLANIDHFKEINDFYGDLYGDYLLLEVANRLGAMLPYRDCRLYKMPGDEYAILFEKGKKSIRGILRRAAALLQESGEIPITILENDVYVKMTIGVAVAENYGEEKIWLEVLRDADIALKTARRRDRSLLLFDPSFGVREEYENNLKWVKIIKEAIQADRIVPYFQPICNNRTGSVEKYECLARMLLEDGTVVSPAFFLEIARKAKIYSDITRIMLVKCFRRFRDVPFEFSINLSAYDILHEGTNVFILKTLRENRQTARRLVFEILESEGIDNYAPVHEFIGRVKKLGVKIAIDDFGTGYSNFEHILRLDVDYIKIDASLTRNLESDRNSQIITRTIADFSRQLGVKTISEFVHSREVYSQENELGVDFSQGYFFGEPRDDLRP